MSCRCNKNPQAMSGMPELDPAAMTVSDMNISPALGQDALRRPRLQPEDYSTIYYIDNTPKEESWYRQAFNSIKNKQPSSGQSDVSTVEYYELPEGATELQDLIAFKDMNSQMGEIFRAVYRYGKVAHSPKIRDIKKIIFYAQKELERLQKYDV